MAKRTAKEILLKHGYTEADISANPMLSDPRFVSAIEAEGAELDEQAAERTRLNEQLTADQRWYQQTALPQMKKALKDAVDARAENARMKEQLRAANEYGLRQMAGQGGEGGGEGGNVNNNSRAPNTPPVTPDPNAADPRYVSTEMFQQTVNQYGEVTTIMPDILDEHRELFGVRLPGGAAQLRKDYLVAVDQDHFQGSIRDFYERKYKVADRREEIAAQNRQKHDDEIRKEERNKVLAEMGGGNPMITPARVSRNPFTNRSAQPPASGGTGNAGTPPPSNPWDRNAHERSTARVSKFAAKEMQRPA